MDVCLAFSRRTNKKASAKGCTVAFFMALQEKIVCPSCIKRGWAIVCALALVLCACNTTVFQATPSLSGRLLIVGSTALQPLTTIAATLFEKMHPQAHLEVRGGGSLFGLNAVTGGSADIGESDVYADPTLYPNPNLTDHIVCIVPFAIIVNSAISLASLTQQQLTDIFSTGKLHNWQELGGPDLPIVPVIRADTSGTRVSFSRYVLGGAPLLPRMQNTNSSQAMVALVARLPGAIGYSALATLTPQVRTVAINGKQAASETIAAGTYAFWGYEHMYTLNTNQSTLLAAFLSFMVTESVQAVARRMGYIPLTQIQLPTQPSSG